MKDYFIIFESLRLPSSFIEYLCIAVYKQVKRLFVGVKIGMI